MTDDKTYFVVKYFDKWAVKKAGDNRASSIHNTQSEAEHSALAITEKTGGHVEVQGKGVLVA